MRELNEVRAGEGWEAYRSPSLLSPTGHDGPLAPTQTSTTRERRESSGFRMSATANSPSAMRNISSTSSGCESRVKAIDS